MTKTETTAAFEKLNPMLHQLAWQCAGRSGRTHDEAYGEACWLFMRAASTFKPGKETQFITYCHTVVRRGLASWGRKMDLPPDPEHLPEQRTNLTPAWNAHLNDWLDNLSDECREVARLILDGPAEALGLMTGGVKIRFKDITKHLRRKGWTWPKIWAAWGELKQAVNTTL